MKVFSPFDRMTKKQKLKFFYIDLISRNLVDEKTAEKDFERELKKLEAKKEKKPNNHTTTD